MLGGAAGEGLPRIPFMHQDSPRYLLISPCRNEAKFMRQTLDTVIAQSLQPAKWVIVDDGSTDETPQILAEYASRHRWIQVVTRTDRGFRAVGPGVVEAFYAGYEAINPDDYDYVCKLDLDLRMPPRYFESLIERMTADPRVATCSGKAYIEQDGQLVYERHGDENSIGAVKFYRMSCFRAIGGFVRDIGWDGIDGHKCRMKGWVAVSWDEPELRFKPYVLGQLVALWGWVWSFLRRLPRYQDPEFRAYLRHYQRRALLVGKKRAIEEWVATTRAATAAGVTPSLRRDT
jgi:glycosyltransferase involved in cell wall biosynthesis